MATVMSHMAAIDDPAVTVRVVPTYVDASRARWLWVGLRGMAVASWLLLTGRADVLHVHLGHGGSVVRKSVPLWVARVRGVRTVVHAHSFDFGGWYATQPRRIQGAVRAALRADQWIILGRDLAAQYADCLALDPRRILVLHNPVHIPELPARSTGDAVLAVSLGRLGQRKGTYDVIAAVASLPAATRSALRVELAGDGEVDEARAAIEVAGLADTMTVHGWLDARAGAELLSRADIFVLPSYAEGLPMALLEAMASGAAVITSPVGSIAEVITDDDTGLLVPPGDVPALAEALTRLVTDSPTRERLAVAARERVRELDVAEWETRLVHTWKLLADR